MLPVLAGIILLLLPLLSGLRAGTPTKIPDLSCLTQLAAKEALSCRQCAPVWGSCSRCPGESSHKKPVLSSRDSRMFVPSSTVRIPPPARRRPVLPPSFAQQFHQAEEPMTPAHFPVVPSEEIELRAQEQLEEGVVHQEEKGEVEEEDEQKEEQEEGESGDPQDRWEELETGALSRGEATPADPVETQGDISALGPNPGPPEGNTIPERAQVFPQNLSCGTPATCSTQCPAQGVLTLVKAEAEADLSCSSVPEKWAKESLEELHRPISQGFQTSSKGIQGQKPSCGPPQSCPPQRAAPWRPKKRKQSMPVALPFLIPWHEDGLPPPAERPLLGLQESSDTLLREVQGAKRKKLEDDAEVSQASSMGVQVLTTSCGSPQNAQRADTWRSKKRKQPMLTALPLLVPTCSPCLECTLSDLTQ